MVKRSLKKGHTCSWSFRSEGEFQGRNFEGRGDQISSKWTEVV